jgi:NitT/TauT family transport system substrate-binding protein
MIWNIHWAKTESHTMAGNWYSSRNALFAVLVVMVTSLAACSPVTPVASAPRATEAELTPLRLGVGFIPSVQFAPFYVGIKKGLFAEEGLEVSLDYGFEDDYVKLVGVNEYQFMVGSGDQVILGRSQGLPVRYVMNWYTRFPVVLFAKENAAIATPADLAGKRIGIPGPFGASYVAYRGILEAGGLTEADVQTESIGFTQAAAVSEGIVDAAVDYAVNGPVVLAQEGIETTQIALDDYLQVPANGLVTNEETLANDPELVGKVVRATQRAIEATLANPDEAFEIALEFVPEAGGENRAANRAIFDASLAYWTPAPGAKPGATSPDAWQAATELMQRIGLIESAPVIEELYTNEYLP